MLTLPRLYPILDTSTLTRNHFPPLEAAEAILESGHKRARPIVMTTVAMVAGMLPVALGLGGDKEFRAPMAIAVIGGLITSTALTLVIVPAAFTLIDDIERWLAPKFGRVLTSQPPPAGTPPQPHPVN